MKAKYKFTFKDFKRWLAGTNKKMYPSQTSACVLACFTKAAGVKDPNVTSGYEWVDGERYPMPIWGERVIEKFDNADTHGTGFLTASETRKLLRGV